MHLLDDYLGIKFPMMGVFFRKENLRNRMPKKILILEMYCYTDDAAAYLLNKILMAEISIYG